MPITQAAFGDRLRSQRQKKRLSLSDVKRHLDERFRVRLSIAHLKAIEDGQRKLTTYELGSLHGLYGGKLVDYFKRDIPGFELVTEVMIASRRSRGARAVGDTLLKSITLHYQMANLKRFCDERGACPLAYTIEAPTTKNEARGQGAAIADRERRRLGLGAGIITDMYRLLDDQGIDVSFRSLPDDVSGAMLAERGCANPFVVVNEHDGEHPKAFALAVEYAHVLMDRSDLVAISFRDPSNRLREVRANAFADAFLMPAPAIREALAQRAPDGRRAVDVGDIAWLAATFAVSQMAMIRRLRELKHLRSAKESDALKEQCKAQAAVGARTLSWHITTNPFVERLIALAQKAMRTHEISRGKFKEIMQLIDVPESRALLLSLKENCI